MHDAFSRSTHDSDRESDNDRESAAYDNDLPLTKASLFQELLTVTGTENLRWEGVHFEYATWLGASGPKGYVDTQSGCKLLTVVSPCAHAVSLTKKVLGVQTSARMASRRPT